MEQQGKTSAAAKGQIETKRERETASLRFRTIFFRMTGHPLFPFAALFVVMFVCFLFVRRVADDLWFEEISRQYGLTEYLSWRYLTWSGRMPAELLIYLLIKLPMPLWSALNALMTSLFSFSVYKFASFKLSAVEARKNLAYFSCILIGLFHIGVTAYSIFWFSGSIVYLWNMTFGMIAFYPFYDSLENKIRPKASAWIIYILFAILASWGQEQVSLCLIGFFLMVLVYLKLKRKKIHFFLLIMTAVAVIGTVLLFSAPGNFLRLQSEAATWYPEFVNLRFVDRLGISFSWMMDRFVAISGLILFFIWCVLGVLLWKNKKTASKATSVLCFLACCLVSIQFWKVPVASLSESLDSLKMILFRFSAFHAMTDWWPGILPYLVWIPLLLVIPLSILLLVKKPAEKAVYLLILAASIGSAWMITFSPTLYASGYRTMFIPQALLLILLALLVRKEKLGFLTLVPFSGVFLLSFLYLAKIWFSGFYLW